MLFCPKNFDFRLITQKWEKFLIIIKLISLNINFLMRLSYAWTDHSVWIRLAPSSLFFTLLALGMLFAPWFRTFLFFYHLLSIFPYIFSFSCDYDCGCNHYCVFFSFSFGLLIYALKVIFLHFFLLLYLLYLSHYCNLLQSDQACHTNNKYCSFH